MEIIYENIPFEKVWGNKHNTCFFWLFCLCVWELQVGPVKLPDSITALKPLTPQSCTFSWSSSWVDNIDLGDSSSAVSISNRMKRCWKMTTDFFFGIQFICFFLTDNVLSPPVRDKGFESPSAPLLPAQKHSWETEADDQCESFYIHYFQ